MTDKELAAAAWSYFSKTTVGWNKVSGYSPERLALTNWGKGKALMDQIVGGVVPAPPPPTGGTRIPASGIISSGGVWYGDPFVGTVRVETTEPVTITGDVRNPSNGVLIYAEAVAGTRITLDHLIGAGGPTWDTSNRLIQVWRPVAFTVRNCSVDYTRGIEITEAAAGAAILITRSRFRNLQGHEANPEIPGNLVQFRSVSGATVEVSWNELVGEQDKSYCSDGISIYNSSGIKVLNNMIFHQSLPGDAPGASSQNSITIEQAGSSGNEIAFNQIVDAHGIGIFAGSNNFVHDNRIVADQFLPDGSQKDNGWLAYWCAPGVGPGNRFRDNVSGYVNRYNTRNDYDLPGASENVNNVKLPDPITAATEQAEWTRWQAKLASAGITIGA